MSSASKHTYHILPPQLPNPFLTHHQQEGTTSDSPWGTKEPPGHKGRCTANVVLFTQFAAWPPSHITPTVPRSALAPCTRRADLSRQACRPSCAGYVRCNCTPALQDASRAHRIRHRHRRPYRPYRLRRRWLGLVPAALYRRAPELTATGRCTCAPSPAAAATVVIVPLSGDRAAAAPHPCGTLPLSSHCWCLPCSTNRVRSARKGPGIPCMWLLVC